MRPLLIVKTGGTYARLRAQRGDYEDWIAAGLGVEPQHISVARVFEGDALPAVGEIAAAVVTGSSAMVTDRDPWSERAAAWLREAVEAGRPVLGICYGHQLLAHAFAGEVAPSPRGREIGTVEVTLTDAAQSDPLFAGLPRRFLAQATHLQAVASLPPGARPLAATALDPLSAFALGPRAWGVQFHPEFDAQVMRFYLSERRELLGEEGIDADALLAAVAESPVGPELLRRFGHLVRSLSRRPNGSRVC